MTTNIVETLRSTQTVNILLAAVACAMADILLKKATLHGNLADALRSPWLLIAIGLYLLQVYFFVVAFIAGSKLSIMGTLLTALYAVIVLFAGILFYEESLTHSQMVGILLAIGGVVLISWPE
jgi:drug/metabolite transporter (DMT)-like permease